MKRLISTALALALISGTAMAQPTHQGNGAARHDNNRHDNRGSDAGRHDNDHRGNNRGGNDWRGNNNGRDFGHNDRGRDWSRGNDHRDFRGYGHSYGYYGGGSYYNSYRPYWRTGDRFYGYGAPYVVINDWDAYHLRRPPYGYHWVRDGNDFLLVAVASGIIADILMNHY